MSDFDDEQLRRAMAQRAGGAVPVAAAHDAVLARAGGIRRRRAAVAGTGGLVALVVAGLVLIPRGDGDSQAPAVTGDPIPTVDDSTSTTNTTNSTSTTNTTTKATVTTTGGSVEVNDPPDDPGTSFVPSTNVAGTPMHTTPSSIVGMPVTSSSVPDSVTTQPAGTTATTETAARAETTVTSTSTGLPASSTPIMTSAPAPTATAPDPTTTAPTRTSPSLGPFTRTYDSAGGSITVAWDGDSFSLLAVAPATGFESEIEDQQATRIRVRFRGDPDDSRIEVRADSGQLTVDIS